jgi:hypothetical protein
MLPELFFYGFDKLDSPGFIPDIVIFTEVFDQHQHVKGIGHGKWFMVLSSWFMVIGSRHRLLS